MKRRSIVLLVFVVLFTMASVVVWCFLPSLPEGLSRRTFSLDERDVTMLVMKLPQSLREYRLVSDPAHPKSVRAWREELGAEVVFNGSYFNEDGSPSGYWKTGKGTSAVAWPSLEVQTDTHGYTFAFSLLVGQMAMRYLPTDPMEEPVDEMFLSFPTLVADGQPMVESDSGQMARRTAVAKDADGRDYVIVTERGTLTLYELSRWLVEQPEHFVIAGNLDGGPSTGISIENNRQDIEVLSAAVPNVIAIYSKLP